MFCIILILFRNLGIYCKGNDLINFGKNNIPISYIPMHN